MKRMGLAVLATLAIGVSGAAAEVSGGGVKIGVPTDYTGTFSGLSGQGGVVAARMAIADFGGRAAGAPVELVTADHQNKADIGSAVVRRWFDQDGVDMVVDVPNSSVALAVQAIAKERSKIVIYAGAGTADLTGKACMPTGFQWVWDTYSVAASTGRAALGEGLKKWYILAADYAFGQTMAADLTKIIKSESGTVVGTAKHPINTPDFASFILQAQATNPDVIALASGGSDTINAVKQFAEFTGGASSTKLVGMAVFISDVHAIGVNSAAGLILTTGFYWDRTPQTREWSQRFFAERGVMPTMAHAGVYSAVLHYLKAVDAAGTDATDKVAAKMREMRVNDIFATDGHIRADGRMVHDMYLAQVKRPNEVKYPWDYYRILKTIPGDETVRPLAESECPLVRK